MNTFGFWNIIRRRILTTGMLVLTAACAGANEANSRTYIIGDRAAGMGGAACAIAESLDACFYNPAGLAPAHNNSVSVSASLYGFDKYSEDDALYPKEHLSTDSFMTIPSSMGSVFALGTNAAVAFSVFVPNKSLISEIVAFRHTQHFFNFYVDDQTLWLGPSFGYAVSPELSVGASVFGVYRTYSQFENIYLGDYSLSESYNLKYQNAGMISMLGAQYRFDDRWNLGLMVQSPSVNLWGSGKYEHNYSVLNGENVEKQAEYAENMTSKNHLPARFNAGLAWREPQRFAVAADISYSLPTSFTRLDGVSKSGESVMVETKRDPVLDMSLGAEYYVWGIYPVRGGFFTGFSSAPDQDVKHPEYPSQLDLYGLTASVGVEKERVVMNVGVSYAFGSGKGLGWDAENENELISRVVDARANHLFIFLNTSYLF